MKPKFTFTETHAEVILCIGLTILNIALLWSMT